MWNYKDRYIFNDLILNEIKNDLTTLSITHINSILDFGCGDGYLLKNLKKFFPSANLFCVEKNKRRKKGIKYIKNVDEIKEKDLDLVLFIDVLYLLPEEEISFLFKKLKNKLKSNGTIYILLGLYAESRGAKIFKNLLDQLSIKYYIHSLKKLIEIFEENEYKILAKRLNINNSKGIILSKKIDNPKLLIDYLYEDKLILKLFLPLSIS